MTKKRILWIAMGLLAVMGLAYVFSLQIDSIQKTSLPYYNYDADSNKLRATNNKGERIKHFSFIDQRGDLATEEQTIGTIYVADYFFVSCPGICKDMGTQMQRIYQAFENEKQVKLLSHTSKPEEDTPAVLMDYAKKMGVKDHDKWLFLTGEKSSLYKIAREQYHIVDDTGDGSEEDFIHTERFVLVDKDQYIRGYYDGTSQEEVDKLIHDIHSLLGHE